MNHAGQTLAVSTGFPAGDRSDGAGRHPIWLPHGPSPVAAVVADDVRAGARFR